MNEKIGIYIHVPFCIRKCPYCDFYSLPFNDETAAAYTAAVLRNIENYSEKFTADTLYFGGGTPSLLGDRLAEIITAAKASFNLKNAEITLEVNPKTTNKKLLKKWLESGVNRISFGVQSLNENELKTLGRIHSAKEALDEIKTAKEVGFDDISADLMIGIPYQTQDSINRSIDLLNDAGATHISAYLLKIEEGTAFYNNNIAAICPDEDTCADMYLQTVQKLSDCGFEQYEISNFAKDNNFSKHNLKYWQDKNYLGIGPSAHSYIGNTRFAVENNLKDFISSPVQKTYVTDNNAGSYEEYAMLALRLSEGIKKSDFAKKYSEAEYEVLRKNAEKIGKQYININENGFNLTPSGFLVSNDLIAKIIFG